MCLNPNLSLDVGVARSWYRSSSIDRFVLYCTWRDLRGWERWERLGLAKTKEKEKEKARTKARTKRKTKIRLVSET